MDEHAPTPPRIPPAPELHRAVSVLRLLADPTRLAILHMLAEQEMSVGEIAQAVDRPTPAVSQHLAKLRAGGLLTSRRQGTSIHYRQGDAHLQLLVLNALHHAEHALYDLPPHHAGDGSARDTS